MRSSTFVAALAALFIRLTSATVVAPRALQCQDVIIPVAVSTQNAQLPADFNITDTQTLLDLVGTAVFDVFIQKTYNIAARYCEPATQVSAERSQTLQVLIHGIAFDKNYWSGLGPPGEGYDGDMYSWVATAAAQGYPTLAIDRLGNGQSDHPDPLIEATLPGDVETTHGVIQAARNGQIPGVGTKFTKIILAGHSYGSLTTNSLSAKYPEDADALILTGFSKQFKSAIPGVIGTGALFPADLSDPAKYGTLDPGYLVTTSIDGYRFLAFGPTGGYDEGLFQFSYNMGTVTAGEGFTAFFSIVEAPSYTGPVYVIDGEQDGIFCCLTGSPLSSRTCGSGTTSLPSMVRTLYPAASEFDYLIEPDTGHCIHLHYTAQDMFNSAHTWLADRGF